MRRFMVVVSASMLFVAGCASGEPDITSGAGNGSPGEADTGDGDGDTQPDPDGAGLDDAADLVLEDGTYVGEVVIAPHIPNVASLDDASVTMVVSGGTATLERVIKWVLDRPQGCTDTERYTFVGEAAWTGAEPVFLFDGTETFEHLATTCEDHDILPSTTESGPLDSVTISHDHPVYGFLEGEAGKGRFQLEYLG